MSWNPGEVLRLVDSLHRDKNIDSEYVFQAIESALVSAARKQYGEESDIVITIDRDAGTLQGTCDGEVIDPEVIGRIGAQTAKQVIIQKIREAERDSLVDEFEEQIGQMVSGVVQRAEGGVGGAADQRRGGRGGDLCQRIHGGELLQAGHSVAGRLPGRQHWPDHQ